MEERLEKRHQLIFVSGSMIANSFIYAMFGRVMYFIMMPGLPEALMWMGLGLQLFFWSILRAVNRKRANDQHMDSKDMIMGGVLGAILSTGLMIYWGTSYPVQYLAIIGGHVIAQILLWNEVTLSGDNKKKQLRLKLIAMLGFLLINFMSEPVGGSGFGRTAIAAVYMVGHIVLLGWLTSGQLIWLAYQEKAAQKAGHVITKELSSIQHTISNRRTSLMSNRLSGLIFLVVISLTGGLLYGISQLWRVGLSYSKGARAFVNLLEKLLGPALTWVYDHSLWIKDAYFEWNDKHVKGGGGPLESVATGDDANVGFTQASDYEQTKQALALLSQIMEISLVVVILILAIWLVRRQSRKVMKAVEKRKSGGENLFDMREWLADVMHAVSPNKHLPAAQADVFRRRYKRCLLLSKRAGLQIELQDTPTLIAGKLLVLRPELAQELELATEVYNALRYGPVKPEHYEAGLKALSVLQKKLK